MVSDVKNSSLQLVEMCSSEGVWSPVCDNNWALQDATVVCRELEKQGYINVLLEMRMRINTRCTWRLPAEVPVANNIIEHY